ncbi:electron transport complex protein, subunit G [Gottschalkia purinilytica]|uniref:Ion-translocating oxidoreductase complex subunit G n=1 Tax=Gottschalkia purinilytica TaxID=1503 RepID=A0A0L0WDC4_GOTPU|nr:RnfABCDGE type electron transport complex subunit G [Gottschalkia purinilytica]KNF09469.1 electron transport complex protein, subunit G [Gottschalkia purinilytica]
MKEITKLGIILLIITSIAGGLLAFANDITKPNIEKVQEKANNEARKEILPKAKEFKALEKDKLEKIMSSNKSVLEVFVGYDSSNKPVGYAIKTATSGYADLVEVITGISSDGKIEGMKVVSNSETPGLGANAANPEYQNQYKGKSAEKELEVVKSGASEEQIQALTGATITSKAVTDGVNTAINAFKDISK